MTNDLHGKVDKDFLKEYAYEIKKHERVIDLLKEANKNNRGKEIVFQDLLYYSLEKLTKEDLKIIKERSLNRSNDAPLYLEGYNIKKQ